MKIRISLFSILFLIISSTLGQNTAKRINLITQEWKPVAVQQSPEKKLSSFASTDYLSFFKEDNIFKEKISTLDILASGHWQLDSNLLILEYDLEPISMEIDSVVYHVDDDRPELIYYQDGKEITRFRQNALEAEKKKEAYEIVELSEDKLILRKQNITYEYASNSHDKTFALSSSGFNLKSLFRGILGLFTVIFLAFLMSSNRRAISWKIVGVGLLVQIIIAIAVLKVPFIQDFIEFVGQMFIKVLDFTKVGSEFLFGGLLNTETYGFIFAFQILPTIIFFSALTSVLFYYGIIQKIVYALAWLMTKALKISGAESLSASGNIFLGQTESPLLIKEYLPKMNRSEIMLVMVGGMATIAGGVLAIYIGLLGGDDPAERILFAKHLITASVMAAPGAVVAAKILVPQTEPIQSEIKITQEKIGSNILEAIANGTNQGLRLAVNVGAMLLVFLAFIAMLNFILFKIGAWTDLNPLIADISNGQFEKFSLEFLLGYAFTPVAWAIGVPAADMTLVAQLFGEKIILNEMIAYVSLKDMLNAASFSYDKSAIIATYILCGFANFSSIGIQLGGIGALAPNKKTMLSQLGFRALVGGALASLLSATIVGMILG